MIKVIERTALDGRIKKLLQGMKCELRYGKTRVYNEDERRDKVETRKIIEKNQ